MTFLTALVVSVFAFLSISMLCVTALFLRMMRVSDQMRQHEHEIKMHKMSRAPQDDADD